MTDDEIRTRVLAGLANRTLPQETPRMAPTQPGQSTQYLATGGSPQTDPCAVCGKGSTQISYNCPEGPIAFHQRCHHIWREEADKPRTDLLTC